MAFHTDILNSAQTIAAADPVSARPGFFARVLAAMMESRQRQANREIAQYLALSGGKLTDTIEREIERRFIAGASRF